MRYIKKEKEHEKIITKFALFPITIDNETRWFEKVVILKKRVPPGWEDNGWWFNSRFVDK